MGVPQGNSPAVTLFGLKIDSIIKAIPLVSNAVYTLMISLSVTLPHKTHPPKLNGICNSVYYINCFTGPTPMDLNSLLPKQSASVSVDYVNYFLNGTPIPVVDETKFLGIIFDCKLSFLPHLQHLKYK